MNNQRHSSFKSRLYFLPALQLSTSSHRKHGIAISERIQMELSLFNGFMEVSRGASY